MCVFFRKLFLRSWHLLCCVRKIIIYNSTTKNVNYTDLDDLETDLNKNGYRIPTYEEWGYLYHSSTNTTYYWGDVPDDKYGWNSGNASSPQAIGGKMPNSFGLYDMAGNVVTISHLLLIMFGVPTLILLDGN